jgi:undecaprenyl-diphosphatase
MVGALVAALVAALVDRLFDLVLAVDTAVVDVVLAVRHPLLTKVMTSVTGLGSAAAALVVLALCHLAGWRRETAVAGVALLAAGIAVVSLMAAVQRPFPPGPVCVTDGPGLAPHSFPSGHAAVAATYATVARRSSNLPFWPVGGLAVVVAVSRIYLGTHYLSDTAFGVGLGVVSVLVARRLLRRTAVGAYAAELDGRLPGD